MRGGPDLPERQAAGLRRGMAAGRRRIGWFESDVPRTRRRLSGSGAAPGPAAAPCVVLRRSSRGRNSARGARGTGGCGSRGVSQISGARKSPAARSSPNSAAGLFRNQLLKRDADYRRRTIFFVRSISPATRRQKYTQLAMALPASFSARHATSWCPPGMFPSTRVATSAPLAS